jgi:hypothetical protein
MKHLFAASASAVAILISATSLSAQEAGSVTAKLVLDIKQPALFDKSEKDAFSGSVDDTSGTTTLKLICSPGASGKFGFGRVDETCAVTGNGAIKNPKNPSQVLQRINYAGGFVIEGKKDGYTNVSTITVNYLRVGSAPAESTTFGGNLVMMPENPSASAKALNEKLLNYLASKTTGAEAVQFNSKIDSIRFENLVIPHVGHANLKSCAWTGDQLYAYANDSWTMKFDVVCGDQRYQLEGNMPLVDVTGSDHQQEYRLNLVVPGQGGADPFAAADPFSTVQGVTGTFKLKNSGRKTDEGVYENVKVSGDLQGTGVPLELVRGYGQIMLTLARTFYGE